MSTDLPADATNVLVLARERDDLLDACVGSVTGESRVLVVGYTVPAGEYVRSLQERAPVAPAEIAVVEARVEGTDDPPDGIDVRVEAPDDLTGIGLQTNEFLTRWRDREAPAVVCFDSITALLQYADVDEGYRFLHVFTDRVRQADAIGFYALAPGAHDDTTEATFRQLFDAVLACDPAGGDDRLRE